MGQQKVMEEPQVPDSLIDGQGMSREEIVTLGCNDFIHGCKNSKYCHRWFRLISLNLFISLKWSIPHETDDPDI